MLFARTDIARTKLHKNTKALVSHAGQTPTPRVKINQTVYGTHTYRLDFVSYIRTIPVLWLRRSNQVTTTHPQSNQVNAGFQHEAPYRTISHDEHVTLEKVHGAVVPPASLLARPQGYQNSTDTADERTSNMGLGVASIKQTRQLAGKYILRP